MRGENQQTREEGASWVRRAYQRHVGLSLGGLASAGLSLVGGTLFGACLTGSGIGNALALYGVSFLIYYGTFLPQMILRDRNQFKDESGQVSSAAIWRKTKEYSALMAGTEVWFGPARVFSLSFFMRLGASPWQAQVASFLLLNTFYFAGLPVFKQAAEDRFGRRNQGPE